MGKKKTNLKWVGAILLFSLALIGLLGSGLLPGSFTFQEQQPLSVTQNGINVVFDQKSFLPNMSVSGTIKSVNGYLGGLDGQSVWTPSPNSSPVMPIMGVTMNGETVIEGLDVFTFVNAQPQDNSAYMIGNYVNNSSPPASRSFSFEAPAALKSSGGNAEVRFVLSVPNWEIGDISGNPQGRRFIGSFSSQTVIVSSVYIESQKCIDNSFVTYEKIFKQGTEISLVPLQGQVGFADITPVFCHSAPVLKQYQDSNQVFEQSNLEYDLLKNGSTVIVPGGQQWVFFYRGLPQISGVLECQNNSGVWNATENRCELPPTLWFECNGILTQQRDCIVQSTDDRCEDPEAILEIESNGNQVCRKYFTEGQTQFICPVETTLKTLETGVKYCEGQPETVCAEGTTLKDSKCIKQGTIAEGQVPKEVGGAVVPGLERLDPILLVVLLVAIGGVIWIAKKKL